MSLPAAENVIYVDPERCMGCRACEIACAVEHSVSKDLFGAVLEKPKPMPRIKVLSVGPLNVPMRCQHCKDAPCVNVCPTKALYRTSEGFVLVDPLKCIGCLMCAIACPFGHPRYSPEAKAIVKCDFCVDRVRRGKPPACVEACPTGALRYGKLEDLLRETAEKKAWELVSGMPSTGLTYYKAVTDREEFSSIIKPSDIKTMYEPVSWS